MNHLDFLHPLLGFTLSFHDAKKHTGSRALGPESERCSARSHPAGRWPSAAFGTVGGIKTGLFVRNQLLLAYHLPDSTSKSQLFWVEVPASRRFLVKVSIQFPTHQESSSVSLRRSQPPTLCIGLPGERVSVSESSEQRSAMGPLLDHRKTPLLEGPRWLVST